MFAFHTILTILYFKFALAISVYQGYRGYRYHWLIFSENNDNSNNNNIKKWKELDKGLVIYAQAAYLYFICSLIGFIALYLSYDLFASQSSANTFDAGTAVLIATTFIIELLGVSGEMGQLIQQGKLPTVK